MKLNQFRQLSELERKAKLCGIITQKTNGKIKTNDIKNIVELLNINQQYKINIINNAKEYAKNLTLIDSGLTHSWAGSNGMKQKGFILFGELEFGENIHKEYSDNGNTGSPEVSNIEPNFNVNEISAVLIEINSWNSMEGHCNQYDDYEYNLCFYIPNDEPYLIDPEIMELIKMFNLE
jgi:hypothetical protein